MLSNKWTFSLTSLVVILALAFVVPSAMAAEFGVTLSVGPDADISSADDIQVAYGGDATVIKIATGAVVQHTTTASVVAGAVTAQAAARTATTLELLDFEVIAYNSFGGTVTTGAPDLLTLLPVTPQADGKSFTMQLESVADTTDITRVLIYIPKHAFEVADPRANLDAGARTVDGKSAEASITIHYVDADGVDPRVLSIRRASDPLLPVKAATENVIILLSEQPKAFTKDHVDATNATWGDPVALVAIPEDPDGLDNDAGTAPPTSGDDNRSAEDRAQYADNMPSTGRDGMVYPYVLTITPKYESTDDIVVKVKAFEDMVLPTAGKYTVPVQGKRIT